MRQIYKILFLFILGFSNSLANNLNDYEKYIISLDESCKKNDLKSCHNLATAFYEGVIIQQDLNAAFILYNKACNGKFLESCFNVGVMSENGQGVKKDEFLAFDKYSLTCTKDKKNRYKQSVGCPNLAILYIDGRGVKQDYKKGIEILDETCKNSNIKSCDIITKIYKDGYLGIKPRPEEFKKILEQQCKKSNAIFCHKLADELLSKNDNNLYEKAILILKKACDLKLAKSCLDLGVLYANGKFVNQNLEIAKDYFGKACDLRDPIGCESYKILNKDAEY
ncbi:Sel1 domain-containing protein [Campylobacter blaseri]|uniref:beta-lactamase n=1 Tax=Campylobacter blaseri TaxID=2042961 RepID=A0A2P8QZR9_9BACT|nr:tetratricopeptide repeat protein [Campylobacter blaseri]PSM51741.1 hypothetical protein CQ405_06325 [Campylobacter blaseri]PSM53532.1 hypothetical protein CRN67_06330 [Campylobacter blaseri]QKF86342.1 Sel1 domain-containing protein [Campylobacter blaseri]